METIKQHGEGGADGCSSGVDMLHSLKTPPGVRVCIIWYEKMAHSIVGSGLTTLLWRSSYLNMHLLGWIWGEGCSNYFSTCYFSFIFIPRLEKKKKPQTKNSRTAMDLKLVAYTSVCIHVCRDRLENLNYRGKQNPTTNVAPNLLGEVTEVMGWFPLPKCTGWVSLRYMYIYYTFLHISIHTLYLHSDYKQTRALQKAEKQRGREG